MKGMSIMKRDAYVDNARLILIFFVVFGHMIQPFIKDSQAINTLYLWIYTFVMPAFIFLSGFFAKGIDNKQELIKLAKKLLLPYVMFQLIYTAYYFFIGKEGWLNSIFYPHWALWFLISLFSWHVLLTVFKKLTPIKGILVAVFLGLIVGYVDEIGHLFSLSRTIVYFPFFLAGYWATREQINTLKINKLKIFSVFIMIATAFFIYSSGGFQTGWLLGSKSYIYLGFASSGAFIRLIVYVTKAFMAISILAWIPQQRLIFTHLGERTVYVYLLHGFFIQFFRENSFFEVNSLFDLLGLATISAAIVLILSTRVVLTVWQPAVEGKITNIINSLKQKAH